jgi:hypothetical protein
MHFTSIMNMVHPFWESIHRNFVQRNIEQVVSTLYDVANKVVSMCDRMQMYDIKVVSIIMRKISRIFDLIWN